MSQRVVDILQDTFADAIVETHAQFGDDTAIVDPGAWRSIAQFLRDDPRLAMDHFIDLTAVDYPDRQAGRFEVVLHLRSFGKTHRIRLKARLDDNDAAPHIDSLSDIWRGANWFERECFDMFGVVFDGHPDLRRILMYEEFEGYPLRKDYPATRIQPLMEFRPEAQGKLPPFDEHEGMPFGRQSHQQMAHQQMDHRPGAARPGGRNLLGFEREDA
jgi:NADH-quinone oxidoreductase subunit C